MVKVRIILLPFDMDIGTIDPKAKGHILSERNIFNFNSIVNLLDQDSGKAVLSLCVGAAGPHMRMVTMDVKLHVGAHRCASSTFQSYLWANRTLLAQAGVTCWTPKRTRDGLMLGLIRDPERITVEDERRAMRSVGRLRLELCRLDLAGQKAVLISEENMMGSTRLNLAQKSLYPLLYERLLRFRPAFEGRRVQIGLCVRSYETYWSSVLAYLVQRGAAKPSVDDLDYLTTQPRRWRHLVRDIAAAFPQADVCVYPFERCAEQPDRVLDLFCPDVARLMPRAGVRHNRSPNLGELNKVLALRGETGFDAGPGADDCRWMPFDEDQRTVLRVEYRRDIAWLEAGADGLARYVDGQQMPATAYDRAQDETYAGANRIAFLKGQTDGIEKRLGRPR